MEDSKGTKINTSGGSTAESLALPGGVNQNRELKRKRSDEEKDPGRLKKEPQGLDRILFKPTVVIDLVSDDGKEDHGSGSTSQAKRRRLSSDASEREKRVWRSPAAVAPLAEVIDLTADDPPEVEQSPDQIQAWAMITEYGPYEESVKESRFRLACRYFQKYGWTGISEEGLLGEVIRALHHVIKLEKQAKETPAQAMKRMLDRRKRRASVLDLASAAAPSRLDTCIYSEKDQVEEDKWSEGDEAATREVVTPVNEGDGKEANPDGTPKTSGNKRRRVNTFDDARGWLDPRIRERDLKLQMQDLAEAKRGAHWKQWVNYTEKNPDWEEKEKVAEEERKRKRKEKREAAKKREQEMQEAGGDAAAAAAAGPSRKRKRGQRRVAATKSKPRPEPPVNDASKEGRKEAKTAASSTKEDENKGAAEAAGSAKGKERAEAVGEAEVPQALDVAEPEGDFDLNDWVSDSDKDSADEDSEDDD